MEIFILQSPRAGGGGKKGFPNLIFFIISDNLVWAILGHNYLGKFVAHGRVDVFLQTSQ